MHNQSDLTSMSLWSFNCILWIQALNNTKLYNWQSYVDKVIDIFRVNIFNICIRCIWLNPTYILPLFLWEHTLIWLLHWSNTLLSKMATCMAFHICIHHDYWACIYFRLSSRGNLFLYFADIIFINFCLLLLTY